MEKNNTLLFNMISKKYTYDILKCLENESKRFKDIRIACEGEKMRAQRLKELETNGLIHVTVKRVGRRPVSFYKLSEKGNAILKILDEMKNAMKKL